jgi:hypothetical protein
MKASAGSGLAALIDLVPRERPKCVNFIGVLEEKFDHIFIVLWIIGEDNDPGAALDTVVILFR